MKKIIIILLTLLVFASPALAGSTTINGAAYDFLMAKAGTWADRNLPNATAFNDGSAEFGWAISSFQPNFPFRSGFEFDLSTIGDDVVIVGATIGIHGTISAESGGRMFKGDYSNPTGVTEWPLYTGSAIAADLTPWSSSAYNVFTLNAQGIQDINAALLAGANFKTVIMELACDALDVTPTVDVENGVYFTETALAANRPYLTVTTVSKNYPVGINPAYTTYGPGTLGDHSVYDYVGNASGGELSVWEAATTIDCVAGTTSPTLLVHKGTYNDKINMAGATTNAAYFRVIMPDSDSWHDGTAGTGVHFSPSGALNWMGVLYSAHENGVGFYGLEVSAADTQTVSMIGIRFLGAGDNRKVIGCIIHGIISTFSLVAGIWNEPTSAGGECNFFAVNNLIYGLISSSQVYGMHMVVDDSSSEYSYLYNNTIFGGLGGTTGISINDIDGSSRAICKNNIIMNCGAPYTPGKNTSTTDVTSGVTFYDSANNDYRLAKADTGALGQGTDLSSDAYYPFSTDGVDADRTAPWDIGFYAGYYTPPATGGPFGSPGFGVWGFGSHGFGGPDGTMIPLGGP